MGTRYREVSPGILEIKDFFPKGIRALQTTRLGGVSATPYDSFNLGTHVGDQPERVEKNRHRLASLLPNSPVWMNQVHGVSVLDLDTDPTPEPPPAADACWTATPERVCAVMTADCLPLLIARPAHQQVAAVHAGWRGLVNGVIEATLDRLLAQGSGLRGEQSRGANQTDSWWIWLGPCIGPGAFEVGTEVRDAFLAHSEASASAFRVADPVRHTWFADLQGLAEQRVRSWAQKSLAMGDAGIYIEADRRCVYRHSELFFSYRRAHQTGRMASLIYCGKP